jgi:hypothetical protein
MRPCPLRDHPRQGKPRELVHAEDVRREDQFQCVARDIFGRAGHAVAAVVEQRVERSARDLHGLAPSLFDARRIAVVDPDAVEPVGLPRGHVLGLAAGGDDAPTPPAQRMGRRQSDARRTPGDENTARQMGHPVLRPENTPSSQAQGNPRTCSPTGRFPERGDAPSRRLPARSIPPRCQVVSAARMASSVDGPARKLTRSPVTRRRVPRGFPGLRRRLPPPPAFRRGFAGVRVNPCPRSEPVRARPRFRQAAGSPARLRRSARRARSPGRWQFLARWR